MNALFRSTLLAAMVVLPAEAFAQSIVQVDETQVETIAYANVGPVSAPAQVHTNPANDYAGTLAGTLSDTEFNPATDLGLKSIYVRH
ncbi:hypothetical protein HHL24_28630 [Paraburkholderia sp. RP-4-7]|uniref:Uncharacterized protein n=1 Tax=Paraburkholderia polaris TaxID=2728848 RepID=A0A848ILW2_9BURK|nr:hypothetical protein [Paraburkholderia polaris]NMM01886.1 hypothetical protein [Paraburkholderia polaris]